MSLGSRSCRPMDVAGFRLDEIEEARPGVFRHALSLPARVARIWPRLVPPAEPQPAPGPDPFVWHALADLLPVQTLETDR